MELRSAAVCYFYFNYVTGLSDMKMALWMIDQKHTVLIVAFSAPNVVYFFLISLYPISVNNQNLDRHQ